ncbi:hypothetical protein ACFLSW_04845 [Candidatus Bipolaricaulota bacterium]
MTRTLFWVGLVAAAMAAAWLLFIGNPLSTDTRFEARNPRIIGSVEDAFDYAGENVHEIDGTATLRMNDNPVKGMIEIDLLLDGALLPWLIPDNSEHSVVLRMRLEHADKNMRDASVHGDSEDGESRLPQIQALYAGLGNFEVMVDGKRQPERWKGFWSIGDAVRQSDGSIRNQGLVFSRLLRDRSGFTDPERLELTLLLYDSSDSSDVLLHLMFTDVERSAG